ncbi:thioredoxin fold domain-containing protein [Aliiglaciecola sp. CAU 1673]|uniref:thioredoxin fold domain-containing protein n=1 Tax=Aliiglaciecola sp. CAU 1673 TaxID=3032595 RepID=UPI0023DAD061|nr:thioredoxin fold domain-containing protein [Aliiglaciecola sp. CAU 1673]MDF2179007.1 thioredoxin fold domain-containing protein [Aliiglaciecola sp. CAU 1673]
MLARLFTQSLLLLCLSFTSVASAGDILEQALGLFDLSLAQFSQDPQSGLLHAKTPYASYYLSEDKRYLLKGYMRQLEDRPRNEVEITDRQAFKAVEAEMITAADGGADEAIYVFIDLDCIHCRYLHSQREQIKALGLTVKYLAYPLEGPGSRGFDKLKAAWCADDPLAAVTTLMADGNVQSPDCKLDLASHQRLGDNIGIGGLPTMVLPDGQILRGRRTALDLQKSMLSNALLKAHDLAHLIPLRNWHLSSLTPSVVPGWLQAEGGYHFFYLKQDGNALFMGEILDLQQGRENLTERSRQALRAQGIAQFNDSMLTYQAKTQKQHLYAFTDLDCERCQALHQAIPKLNAAGITVSLLALPAEITSLYEPPYAKAWCQGLPDVVIGEDTQLIPAASCDIAEVLREHSYFAYRMAVGLAPVLMLPDGQLLPFSNEADLALLLSR